MALGKETTSDTFFTAVSSGIVAILLGGAMVYNGSRSRLGDGSGYQKVFMAVTSFK